MSQRNSGYARNMGDFYETPAWVTAALMWHVPAAMKVWEPACGSGKMAEALMAAGHEVMASDLARGQNFLRCIISPFHAPLDAIITNPPYGIAAEFIEHALDLMKPCGGLVAMLLRTDFDHAASRRHLFADHPAFAAKLVLTKRIRWFEESTGSPSFNHAWFIWDWRHRDVPRLAYGPAAEAP
jgi:hypothetical protein